MFAQKSERPGTALRCRRVAGEDDGAALGASISFASASAAKPDVNSDAVSDGGMSLTLICAPFHGVDWWLACAREGMEALH